MIRQTIFLILLVLFFSCEKKEKIDITNTPNIFDSLEYKLNNKPKLFLKFWTNMSSQEFDSVTQILIKDKILEKENFSDIFYLTPNCKSELKPIFINNSLKELQLENGVDLYPIFKQKYGLPNLEEKRLVERRYIEKNISYNPKTTYINDNNEVRELPEAFVDKSNYNNQGRMDLPIDENGLKEKILPNSPLIIYKENVVITFTQSFYQSPKPLITYSLDLSPMMQQYKLDNPLFLLTKQGQFLTQNSKYTISEILKSSVITISYKDKLEYEKNAKRVIEATKNLEKENALQKKMEENRNQQVNDEI